MTNPLRPGSVREQAKAAREQSELRAPYRDTGVEPSDPPRSMSPYPPLVVPGEGSKGLPRGKEYAEQQGQTPTHRAFVNTWAVVAVILGSMAAGFGGAKALTPDYTAKLDKIDTKIESNEKTRQQDQDNVQKTIAGLHEEIALLKQALHIQETLPIPSKAPTR